MGAKTPEPILMKLNPIIDYVWESAAHDNCGRGTSATWVVWAICDLSDLSVFLYFVFHLLSSAFLDRLRDDILCFVEYLTMSNLI